MRPDKIVIKIFTALCDFGIDKLMKLITKYAIVTKH